MSLSEAVAAARDFRQKLDPGDLIDQRSAFSASHLDLLIEWAATCSNDPADGADPLRDIDVTQLGDPGLAHFYFSELDIDPDLQSETGRRLREEIERRGLTQEQLGALIERTRQTLEATRALEAAERDAPPHFPEDVELPPPS